MGVVRVKMLKTMAGPEGTAYAGQEVEVEEDFADLLIAAEAATCVKFISGSIARHESLFSTEPEEAVIAPPEKAVTRRRGK